MSEFIADNDVVPWEGLWPVFGRRKGRWAKKWDDVGSLLIQSMMAAAKESLDHQTMITGCGQGMLVSFK
jgi:hypothetical protein